MNKPNGFIRIERELWRSPDVLALSLPAKIVLTELHYCYTGRNNGKIMLSYATLRALHRIGRATIWRAFNELKSAGLIETTVEGSFNHKDGARKGIGSQYRLLRIPNPNGKE